jgi:hypothetical protein
MSMLVIYLNGQITMSSMSAAVPITKDVFSLLRDLLQPLHQRISGRAPPLSKVPVDSARNGRLHSPHRIG